MTSFPGAIYTPRDRANKDGVVYDPDEETIIYVEDVDKTDDEIYAIEEILGGDVSGASASLLARLIAMDSATALKVAIAPRVKTTVSSATPNLDTDDYDCHTITALDRNITSMSINLSGTPANFQKLLIRIKDDGTAREIIWGSKFANGVGTLPDTTILGKVLLIGFIYDTVTSDWHCDAVGSRP